ncbi:GNAT family N-acetyltransferase [Kocuria sediminis]|uniref:GNAT family N-acetyltransferase n=1 Tax=Kocuria sediminis TaxID=1038857 RepID=A0A6N8GKL7_9MICC|nr:GNAT family N-acetyltransferase [Kocuria sediminis]MUN63458.1 GNAT family N-acetyltransferase [Kocuria sediminis]
MSTTRGERPARSGDPRAEVRALRPVELPAAVGLIARGMRDNPVHHAAYGPDPDRRLRCHARVIRALLAASPALHLLGVTRQGALVAVAAEAPPGTCRLTTRRLLRMLPHLARLGPRTALRVRAWTGVWAAHDPAEPHVHLGPVAVDAHLQGRGLGTAVLREHCRRLDATGQVGYLETDKPANVVFYRRFGYEVVGQAPALGLPTWFMRRPPAAR